MPFGLGLNTFFSLEDKHAGSNFKLGFYTVDISIKSGNDGLHFDGFNSKEDKSSIDENKKKFDLLLDKRLLSYINIDRAYLTLLYGNVQNSYNTCMVCSVINNLSIIIGSTFSDRIRSFKKVIIPVFDRDCLFFQLRVDLKVNLFIIFSTFFKIIIMKLTKKLGLRRN